MGRKREKEEGKKERGKKEKPQQPLLFVKEEKLVKTRVLFIYLIFFTLADGQVAFTLLTSGSIRAVKAGDRQTQTPRSQMQNVIRLLANFLTTCHVPLSTFSLSFISTIRVKKKKKKKA